MARRVDKRGPPRGVMGGRPPLSRRAVARSRKEGRGGGHHAGILPNVDCFVNGSVRDAVRLAWVGDHETIAQALRGTRRRSIEHAILRSAIAGEPELSLPLDSLIRTLATPTLAMAFVADRAIMFLLRKGHVQRARAILEAVGNLPDDLRPVHLGQLALVAAFAGSEREAHDYAVQAEAADPSDDDLISGLTKGWLARAYFHLARYDLSTRHALSAALHFERIGAARRAASILGVPMVVAHVVHADVATAREYGERALSLMIAQGFQARAGDLRATLLLFAAELADHRRYERLESEAPIAPFPARLARVLSALAGGNVESAKWHIAEARIRDISPAQRCLCDALFGLSAIASGDNDMAFAMSQRIETVGPAAADPRERRHATLATILTVAINRRLGRHDVARTLVRRVEGTIESPLATYSLGQGMPPPALRGYAAAIDAARQSKAQQPLVRLTVAERNLLPLLSAGKDVRVIALETHRSAATVRTHLERMRAKLGVTRSGDVVQRARDLGIA